MEPDRLLDVATPGALKLDIPGMTRRQQAACVNTTLTYQAMRINDAMHTTPQEKEAQLLDLFKDSPYELSFTGEYA